jgi:hypothetical protein
MKAKQRKRERQGEQLGHGLGLIVVGYSRHEDWIERVEQRLVARTAYAWALARVRPNEKESWSATTGFPFWIWPPKLILGVKQHDNDGGDRGSCRT